MKTIFLKHSLRLIKKYNTSLNHTQLAEIEYGLESFYLTISKLLILLLLAFCLNILVPFFLLIISFNLIRFFAYGFHATHTGFCFIITLIGFILLPFFFIKLNFNFITRLILSSTCFICFLLYAPSDTEKRPLLNKTKRKQLKKQSLVICSLYLALIFFNFNPLLTNILLLALLLESITILPLTYRFLKLPYQNYKRYQ